MNDLKGGDEVIITRIGSMYTFLVKYHIFERCRSRRSDSNFVT